MSEEFVAPELPESATSDLGGQNLGFQYPEQPLTMAATTDSAGEALLRRAWLWAAASVLLFPILALWSIPSAAATTFRAGKGDLVGAAQSADLCKKLGIAALAVFAVVVVLWILMMGMAVSEISDAA